jgi:RimJ/RimL family protein N-acetyltransferase
VTPILETSRLILRPFTPDDWPAVDAMVSDPQATRYMHFARWTPDQRRRWFDWCVSLADEEGSDVIAWVIARREAGDVIGWFGIGSTSRPTVPGERSFGYLLRPAFWNQGYMTEALHAVLDYEFGVRDTPRVSATCETANEASLRVMEKAGMHRENTVYDDDFEGNWAYRHHYFLTRAEYGARDR